MTTGPSKIRSGNILIVTLVAGWMSLLWSCDGRHIDIPDSVLSRDSMVRLMADIHVAESRLMISIGFSGNRDSKAAYMQQVLSDAGVDTARFIRSFDFYSAHPEFFSEMYDDVITELSKRQSEKGKSE